MNLLQDLRFALRQLSRAPGFALTAVVILSLGIAANVIVFGVLQGLILRPLNVPHPDDVMELGRRTSQEYPIFSYPEIRDVRDHNTVFSSIAAYTFYNVGLEAGGISRPVWAYEVSGQYFEVAAINPFLGRLLQRADDVHTGASDAVVLSWPAWKDYFNADPNIVGRKVRINKKVYTVVGVAPEGFYGTEKFFQPDVFVPLANQEWIEGVDTLEQRRVHKESAIVRLKEGVGLPQAQAELNAIANRVKKEYPTDEDGLVFRLIRPGFAGEFLGGPLNGFLIGVMVLAGIVLVAACANLGSLFALRTLDRTREIAIRVAIGSNRWRIFRQLLVEALLISILAGICACALAWLTLTALADWRPPTPFPFKFLVLPQPSLILVALLISVLAAILFGLLPLRQIFATDPNDALKSGGVHASTRRGWALRDFLLTVQIALCCVTVTAAFVSLRGLAKAMNLDAGFKPAGAIRTEFDLGWAGYKPDAAASFQKELLDRISHLPGVQTAGYARFTPLSVEGETVSLFSETTTDFKDSNQIDNAWNYSVSPGYFAASGTSFLAGRDVTFGDTPETPLVAVVNRQLAREVFHSEDVIGRFFKTEVDGKAGALVRIVGLVADGKYLSLSEDPAPAAFFPISQQPATNTVLIVRTAPGMSENAAGDIAATIRKVIRDLDPAVPIRDSGPWTSQLALSLFPSQVATVALSLFGGFGLLLSITGTFGVASYTVGKRLRELSIRVALGAQGKHILWAALGRMLVLLGTGSVIGILLGVATGQVLSAIVYQASAQDPSVLAAVGFTVLITGCLSLATPVRRALLVDPARLLREE
jgi:predicted permease